MSLFLMLLLAGCGGGNKLVGTWEGSQNGMTATMTFKGDNTWSAEAAANPTNPAQKVVFSGDYKLEGDKCTMTMKDAKLEGASAQEQAQFKQFAAGQLNKSETSTLAWKSDNEVEVTSEKGQKTTWKRKA